MIKKVYDAHCHLCFDIPIAQGLMRLRENQKRTGISGGTILGVPLCDHCHGEYDATENVKALYYKEKAEGEFTAFAGFEGHSDNSDYYMEFAKKALDIGFDGFKSLLGLPYYRKKYAKSICDASLSKFFSFLEENGIPFVLHAGNPRYFWNVENKSAAEIEAKCLYDSSFQTLEELHQEVEALLAKFPKLRITFAHFLFMGDQHDRIRWILDTYENVTVDLAPGGVMFTQFARDIETWREFFIQYQTRILYGTDNYLTIDDAGIQKSIQSRVNEVHNFLETDGIFYRGDEALLGIALDTDALQNICWNNAVRRAASHPIQKQCVAASCERILREDNRLMGFDEENLKRIIADFS